MMAVLPAIFDRRICAMKSAGFISWGFDTLGPLGLDLDLAKRQVQAWIGQANWPSLSVYF
jgi:hypothetical protein